MKRKLLILLALFIAICSANSPIFGFNQSNPTGVNLHYDGTYILVPVKVSEHNLMFILDTAAGGSVISPATRDLIGFTEKDGDISEIVGAGGTTQYQSIKIPSINFGGYAQKDFNVTVIELKKFQKKEGGEPYAGILGNDFLRSFDVEINLPSSKLYLYRHNEKAEFINPKLKGKSAILNEAQAEGFIAFTAFLGGKPVNAILDTGAPISILNWQAARQINVNPETKGVKKQRHGTGGLGNQKADTFLYTFKNIRAGNTQFSSRELRIADLSIFKALGMHEKPAMIFGLDMLKKHIAFISYRTKKIYFY